MVITRYAPMDRSRAVSLVVLLHLSHLLVVIAVNFNGSSPPVDALVTMALQVLQQIGGIMGSQ